MNIRTDVGLNGKSALWALPSLLAAVISLTGCGGSTSPLQPHSSSISSNSISLQITNPVLPNAALQTAYTATLTARGGKPPYSWSVANGDIPPGLSLNSTAGALSGTPTAPGAFSFTADLQDSDGVSISAEISLNVSNSAMPTTSNSDGSSTSGSSPLPSPTVGSAPPPSPAAGSTPPPSNPTSTSPSQTQLPQSGAGNSTGSTASVGMLSLGVQSVSFASVTVGASQSQTVVVSNSGSANVTISNITVSGPGVSAAGLTIGLVLAPQQTAELNVAFAPAATGTVTGGVVITSNATNSTTSITVSGIGVQPAVSHAVDLTWSPSTSTDISGYAVYRGLTSDGPFTMLTTTAATTYTDNNVQSGQTYYYVLTAVDSNNVESGFSTPASATIP